MVNTSLRYIKPESEALRTKARPLSNYFNNLIAGGQNMTQIISKEVSVEEIISPEDKAFFAEMDYFNTYGELNGLTDTRWSIFDEGIKMGDDSPFEVGTVFRNKCIVWNYDVSGVLKGNRWGDVWALCNRLIKETDDHHIYIEGFEKVGNEIHISTGS